MTTLEIEPYGGRLTFDWQGHRLCLVFSYTRGSGVVQDDVTGMEGETAVDDCPDDVIEGWYAVLQEHLEVLEEDLSPAEGS